MEQESYAEWEQIDRNLNEKNVISWHNGLCVCVFICKRMASKCVTNNWIDRHMDAYVILETKNNNDQHNKCGQFLHGTDLHRIDKMR